MGEFVNLENARHDDQRDVMKRINNDGVCPFCPENLNRYHTEPILRTGEHWIVTHNQWPYEHTEKHLLAIARTHVERLGELAVGSFDELLGHLQWAENQYSASSGGIAMRFGDVTKNGASVRHLHMHFIVPTADNTPEETVRFKIG